MEVTRNNIEEYIRRFMEGETTNAEEQAIYRFFRTEEVPKHLKPYTEMFAWYEEGMPEEELSKPKAQPLWKRIPLEIWSTGIAAMLVIGIGLGIVFSIDNAPCEEWACYEGSYVEVNGKRITDIETILPILSRCRGDRKRCGKTLGRSPTDRRRNSETRRNKYNK